MVNGKIVQPKFMANDVVRGGTFMLVWSKHPVSKGIPAIQSRFL